MRVEKLLEQLKEQLSGGFDHEQLGRLVYDLDFGLLDYRPALPEISNQSDYTRNILLLDPLEVVLLRWPPGAESAIHHHEGFYGYVVVLDGIAQDVTYTCNDGHLRENRISRCYPGGIIDEPDGVLHKICNPSNERELISLHFYYPALETLEDLHIYHVNKRSIGILSKEAKTASWSDARGHFKEIRSDAFDCDHLHSSASHKMVVVKPKPDKKVIGALISAYYSEQAHVYDYFDFKHPTRKAYTRKINELVGESMKDHQIGHLLSIAVGTGRRSVEIREISGQNFKITGVDISPEMVEISRNRGIDAIAGDWLEVDLGDRRFDAATCLYAFGHITSSADRLHFLQKTGRHLKPGAPFYLDVFNVDNVTEWGPKAVKTYEKENLDSVGYERGDVFYMKTGGKEIAFLHYMTETELLSLLARAGFRVDSIQYVGYVQHSGQLVDDASQGFFLVKAIKE